MDAFKAAVVPLAQHMIHDEMASMSILIHVRLDISPAVVSDDVGSSRDLQNIVSDKSIFVLCTVILMSKTVALKAKYIGFFFAILHPISKTLSLRIDLESINSSIDYRTFFFLHTEACHKGVAGPMSSPTKRAEKHERT